MPDNHSVEVLLLSAEPEALVYLCNSAPAHGVTPVTPFTEAHPKQVSGASKNICETMSFGHFFVLYSGINSALLHHGFAVWMHELEGLVNVRGVPE